MSGSNTTGGEKIRTLAGKDLNRDGKVSRDEFDELVSDLEYVVRGNLIGYWAHLAITS